MFRLVRMEIAWFSRSRKAFSWVGEVRYWSTSGLGGQGGVLVSPESGRCYALRGDNAPFYASNHTGRTVRSYESRGCKGEAQSSIEPGGVGHVYKYVKFG